jgi:hypothetical protein
MQRIGIRIFLLLLLYSQENSAKATFSDSTRSKRWYLPHQLPLQFAGNIGLFSTGIGYTSKNDNYELNILYGYVPAAIGEADIHMLTAKNIFPLSRYRFRSNQTFIPYLGVGLTFEAGGNAFFKTPSHYPKGYYDFPKNLHVIGYGGVKVQHLFQDDLTFLRGIEFYAEGGTVDIYLWYKAISDQIKFDQIFTLALGVNVLLNH